jgi:hypothetical protein
MTIHPFDDGRVPLPAALLALVIALFGGWIGGATHAAQLIHCEPYVSPLMNQLRAAQDELHIERQVVAHYSDFLEVAVTTLEGQRRLVEHALGPEGLIVSRTPEPPYAP